MKVLNLYAGIGGNRKLWEDVEVTAVENNQDIANIYKDFFPNDTVIVADAHQYLLDHFKEFDFIWGSPPCPSHSIIRKIQKKNGNPQNKPIYPDMKLYQEILLLQGYFDGKWIIENVIPWYAPLIIGTKIQRHIFWSNFNLGNIKFNPDNIRDGSINELTKSLGFYGINNLTLLRNCVNPKLGLHLLNMARGIIKSQDVLQTTIFD